MLSQRRTAEAGASHRPTPSPPGDEDSAVIDSSARPPGRTVEGKHQRRLHRRGTTSIAARCARDPERAGGKSKVPKQFGRVARSNWLAVAFDYVFVAVKKTFINDRSDTDTGGIQPFLVPLRAFR
jgi:hypothetical protein